MYVCLFVCMCLCVCVSALFSVWRIFTRLYILCVIVEVYNNDLKTWAALLHSRVVSVTLKIDR